MFLAAIVALAASAPQPAATPINIYKGCVLYWSKAWSNGRDEATTVADAVIEKCRPYETAITNQYREQDRAINVRTNPEHVEEYMAHLRRRARSIAVSSIVERRNQDVLVEMDAAEVLAGGAKAKPLPPEFWEKELDRQAKEDAARALASTPTAPPPNTGNEPRWWCGTKWCDE